MRGFFAAWDRYWMRPAPASALAMFRIAFFSAVLVIYFRLDDRPWAELSPVLWKPVSVFYLIPRVWMNPDVIGWAQTVWKISLAAATIGWFTRAATISSALLGLFLLGLPNNFGKIDHQEGIVAILLCILCVSYCGDDLSIDAQFRRRVPAFSASSSFEYGWPLRLCRVLFVMLFFAAGVAKLRASGLAWMTADNLRYLLLSHAYASHPPTNLGLLIAKSRVLCEIGAVSTLALEISMPLLLFFERLRYPLGIALLILQTMIALCLGVYFTPYLAAYLALLPWERWAEKYQAAAAGRSTTLVQPLSRASKCL